MSEPTQYEKLHYGQLLGKTIVKVEMIELEPGFDFIPLLTFADGTYVMCWCDPEGNGAGWLGYYDEKGNEPVPPGLRTGDFEKGKP